MSKDKVEVKKESSFLNPLKRIMEEQKRQARAADEDDANADGLSRTNSDNYIEVEPSLSDIFKLK